MHQVPISRPVAGSGILCRFRQPAPALDLAFIVLVACSAMRAFWQPGVSSPADMLIGIYRVFELDQSWHQQVLFPRIGMGLMFGFGAPLFQYYPPLASYVALPFHWAGLGWIESAKAVFSASLLLAGLGSYVYARWLFGKRPAALVAAIAYMLAPYLLLDIYERGAAAEVLALALLPWLFWSMHRLLRSASPSAFWSSAACVAMLMLAHNITAFFVLPILSCYLLLLSWRGHTWSRLRLVILSFALGLGLSAFYWVPALAEQNYSQLASRMMTAPLQPLNHLVSLAELVQRQWAFDYWGPARRQLPLWQAVLAPLAALGIVRQVRALKLLLVLLTLILAAILLLQLHGSGIFWQAVPLVRFIQFPWRLYGLGSFCAAMLLGSLLCLPGLPRLAAPGIAAFLILVVSYAGLRSLDPKLSSIWYPLSSENISKIDEYERGRIDFALYSDYMPAAMQVLPSDLAKPRPAGNAPLPPLAVPPRIKITAESPNQISLQVHAPAAFTLRLPRLFFPAWQVYVAGRPVPTGPQGPFGLVAARLPAGDYLVNAHFDDTPLRVIANIVSVLCLLAMAACALRDRRARLALAICVGSALLLAGLAWRHQGIGQSPYRPAEYTADFQDEIRLLGYQLEPASPRPGDTLRIRLYWLTERTPQGDYKVFSHLVRSDDSGPIAQGDSMPLHGYRPTSQWDPGDFMVDEQEIKLPADLPPGAYELLIGMYRPESMQNLAVHDAPRVLPGDRVVLSGVTVRGR